MGANNINAQNLSVPKVLTGICADGHILEWDRGRIVFEAKAKVAVDEIVVELFAEIFNLSACVVPESRRIRSLKKTELLTELLTNREPGVQRIDEIRSLRHPYTLTVALVLGTEALHGVEGV